MGEAGGLIRINTRRLTSVLSAASAGAGASGGINRLATICG